MLVISLSALADWAGPWPSLKLFTPAPDPAPAAGTATARPGPVLRLSLALGASAAPARADADPQGLVVTLSVNGEARGERIVYRAGASGFLVKAEELAEFARLPEDVTVRVIDGERFVALDSITGTSVSFDENEVALAIMFLPELLEKRTYNLARARPPEAEAASASALFNYRLAWADGGSGSPGTLSLATEQGIGLGAWLLRNQTHHLENGGSITSVRYQTQLQRDDRASMRRLTLGDTFTAAGDLGGAVEFGGISLVKAYQLSPYFVRQPSLHFAGTVPLPSEVDLYVGGARILRERVAPGTFEIANVNYYGGQRDVRVVIRDLLGREQAFDFPFFFSDQTLAAGLHDYAYQIGRLREDFGVRSNEYGEAAWSMFHKYGFSDAWTLGVRSQGTRDYGNLGPTVTWRSDDLGVVSASLAGSWDRARSGGYAWALSHGYQAGDFSSALLLRRYGDGYAVLRGGSAPALPGSVISASLGYAPRRLGSLRIGYDHSGAAHDRPQRTGAALSYSRPLARRASLIATYRRMFGGEAHDELFLGLLFLPRPNDTASAALRTSSGGAHSEHLQYGNTLPTGEGIGYRLALERRQDETGATHTVTPELRYHARHATLAADAQTQSGAADATTWTLSVSGAVAAVGGRVMLSRTITDSFALAQITPPLAGVRVYQSSQEVGRTDANGRLLLSDIAPFIENYVSIDDRDIPIEYTLERKDRVIAPAYRSGTVVEFPVSRIQSVAGRLAYRSGGQHRPLEFVAVSLAAAEFGTHFITGRDGDFYIENLAPGDYHASTQAGAHPCHFTFSVPAASEAFVTLGEILACDVAP